MSKQQLIDAIQQHNRSATQEFLFTFDEQALSNYLSHLVYRTRPRGVASRWIRPTETHAVVTRRR